MAFGCGSAALCNLRVCGLVCRQASSSNWSCVRRITQRNEEIDLLDEGIDDTLVLSD